MVEAFFTNPYAVIGSILLACFVGYIGWRNNYKSRRAAACYTFRSAFLSELGTIYPTPANWPANIDNFLRAAFPRLQSAVVNFKPYVPWWHRKSFDNAWFVYRLGSDGREIDQQCYHQYMSFESNPNYKDKLRENVDRLLSYANET